MIERLIPKLTRFPFKNLVFQGGGIRALVYHGVIPVLEEYDILPQIERVAGASAGATQAVLLCFRRNAQDTIDMIKDLDFSQITSTDSSTRHSPDSDSSIKEHISKIWGNMELVDRFVNKFGLYSNQFLSEWLTEVIAYHCEGNGRATFSDFRAFGFRDLYIPVVNVSRHKAEILSASTTPDVSVVDAVIMSSTIPFFFEAMRFDGQSFGKGDYYIDGGVLNNYPLTIFDNSTFKEASHHFTYGVNWETLGCRLFTPQDCQTSKSTITNILGFTKNVVETIAEMQNVAIELRTVDQLRSISISDCCVSTIDFDLFDQEGGSKYEEMVQAGALATREYLERYRLPTDWFGEMKDKIDDFLHFNG